jgi:hypothetical protein
MPPPEARGRKSGQHSAPCGRVVPIGGQVEPSAQLKAVPTGVQPAPGRRPGPPVDSIFCRTREL